MKTFKFLLACISLVIILSSCNLPSSAGSPTQTKVALITPLNTVLAATASPITTPIPPNTPAWLVYNYTCKLAVGGADMTMNLSWDDRSANEEGFKVYRDGQVIATLVPNSTYYVDVAFVAAGSTLSYKVEAFNADWKESTSTIAYGCE